MLNPVSVCLIKLSLSVLHEVSAPVLHDLSVFVLQDFQTERNPASLTP